MIAVPCPGVTINAAFFRELKVESVHLQCLLDRLESLLLQTRPSRDRILALADLADQLRRELASRFALEETYGYFERPLAVAPELGEVAVALREQHKSLYGEICEVADYLAFLVWSTDSDATDHEADLIPFVVFCIHLQHHENAENALILEVFYGDLQAIVEEVNPAFVSPSREPESHASRLDLNEIGYESGLEY
jgi:hypothetical protein